MRRRATQQQHHHHQQQQYQQQQHQQQQHQQQYHQQQQQQLPPPPRSSSSRWRRRAPPATSGRCRARRSTYTAARWRAQRRLRARCARATYVAAALLLTGSRSTVPLAARQAAPSARSLAARRSGCRGSSASMCEALHARQWLRRSGARSCSKPAGAGRAAAEREALMRHLVNETGRAAAEARSGRGPRRSARAAARSRHSPLRWRAPRLASLDDGFFHLAFEKARNWRHSIALQTFRCIRCPRTHDALRAQLYPPLSSLFSYTRLARIRTTRTRLSVRQALCRVRAAALDAESDLCTPISTRVDATQLSTGFAVSVALFFPQTRWTCCFTPCCGHNVGAAAAPSRRTGCRCTSPSARRSLSTRRHARSGTRRGSGSTAPRPTCARSTRRRRTRPRRAGSPSRGGRPPPHSRRQTHPPALGAAAPSSRPAQSRSSHTRGARCAATTTPPPRPPTSSHPIPRPPSRPPSPPSPHPIPRPPSRSPSPPSPRPFPPPPSPPPQATRDRAEIQLARRDAE